MFPPRYIQYINLPAIPQDLISEILRDTNQHLSHNNIVRHGQDAPVYIWSDLGNEAINNWCQKNISAEMYFAFAMMPTDVYIHKDKSLQIKLNYLIDPGGNQVLTNFYDDDHNLLASYCVEPGRWWIINANVFHSVTGLESGRTRFSVTGKIF
jgi:hypothetical protein